MGENIEMKLRRRVLFACLGLTFFFLIWVGSVAFYEKENRQSKAFTLFTEAMQKEKVLQIRFKFEINDSINSPNNIPKVEKSAWAEQYYLFYKDKTRHLLDSLFRVELLANNLRGKSAIRLINGKQFIMTSSDSSFYQQAMALKPIVYRKDYNPDNNITLQGCVAYSVLDGLPRNPIIISMSCLWLLFIGVLVVYYFRSKKKIMIDGQKVELTAEKKEKVFPAEWLKLLDELYFDPTFGDLYYKNEVRVRLKDNSLRLFNSFVNAKDLKLTYEVICVDVLGRSVKNGIDKLDKSVVSASIRNLRDVLSTIPFIQIEAIRGVGYQLHIKPSETKA